ncbi:MAG TPA: hypothetical protein VKH44_07035 [Pirellulaceae bacterium]|nr:hypothetical protein [Pirellulaceae bacterium]
MPMKRFVTQGRTSRRSFLGGALAISCAPCIAKAQENSTPPPDPDCPRCGGVGRIPLLDAKPFVWMKGTPRPKADAAIGEQSCPLCQRAAKADLLAAEVNDWIDAALEKNKQWEERTGWKLACLVTRHATVHTQLTPDKARPVGMALESLALHLKRLTGSLALTSTRPDTFELMLLWEKAAWEQFRKVMEGLYTLEQLGPSWISARLYNAYDHFATPHTYETPQSVRIRPPSCGAVFIVGRRQLSRATDWHTPFWLAEGFAAYCDNAVHKVNRWYTVYDVKQVPVGDWLADARKLAAESKLRTWKEMMKRELHDWEPADHVQTMATAAFLLESEPAKFLDLAKRLKSGDQQVAALEDAYRTQLDELEQRCTRWLLARR